jgi:cytochrome P450
MVKDFDYFVDRRQFPGFDKDSTREGPNQYFGHMLTMLEGEKWKQMRSTLSPVFTSGKLKGMNAMINKVIPSK